MSVLHLVRADLRDFAGYRSARSERLDGDVWLNANEAACANAADGAGAARRYPEPQPDALRAALATLYGCDVEQLLIGRGSDEAIDLLVRAFCAPGQGAIVVTPPTFGMYAVSARLHGARVVEVPLIERDGRFDCDFGAVAAGAVEAGATLVFLCSPGNPIGQALPIDSIDALARDLKGRAIVVVDEAYHEFADAPSGCTLLADRANVVVLRTLSKAHALAGARIGVAIADRDLIDVLRRCQAPYPVPQPCIGLAQHALAPAALAATRAATADVVRERERVAAALRRSAGVRRVHASDANFLLVRFDDATSAFERLLAAGVVVRDVRAQPGLGDALRISIGRADENDRVLATLVDAGVAA